MSQREEASPAYRDNVFVSPAVIEESWLTETIPVDGTDLNSRSDSALTLSEDRVTPQPHSISIQRGNLYLAIGNALRNAGDDIISPDTSQRAEIISALNGIEGIVPSDSITDKEISQGIENAKRAVISAKAEPFLKDLKFKDGSDLPTTGKPLRIRMNGAIAIDPRYILGAQSLTDWSGKGYQRERHGGFSGRLVTKSEEGVNAHNRPSIEVIEDYATRYTQLPPNSEVKVFLTDTGMFAYAYDSHRVAAAQLRREPVRVAILSLYDYRGTALNSSTQTRVDSMLDAVNSNAATP